MTHRNGRMSKRNTPILRPKAGIYIWECMRTYKSSFAEKINAFPLSCHVVELQHPPMVDYKEIFHNAQSPNAGARRSHQGPHGCFPLIEELRELWTEGTICNDAGRWQEEARLTLRAMLLWCVYDFPTYAMMARTSNKEYCACYVCGPNTPARHSQHLSKVVYGGSHWRWLPAEHPYRYDTNVFMT